MLEHLGEPARKLIRGGMLVEHEMARHLTAELTPWTYTEP